MIGCSLVERYFRFKTGTHLGLSEKEKKDKGLQDYDERFKQEAAQVLGVPVVKKLMNNLRITYKDAYFEPRVSAY